MPAHLIAEEGPHRGLVLNLEEGDEWVIGRDPDAADFVVEDSTVSRKHARLIKTPEGISLKNLSRINPTVINNGELSGTVLLKEGDRIQIGNTTFLFSEEAVPDLGDVAPKKPNKQAKGYDEIFGDIEEPEADLPPPPAAPESEELAEEVEPEQIPEEAQEEAAEEIREPTAYDTIFEDAGGEEDLPFNLVSETPLLLKVISGPNAGAEIGIEKGRIYTIGKDPNACDVHFQDLSVSRTHARLSVSPEGVIEIEDLGSKNGTVVNGAPIAEKRVITPQDLIAMGTTVFLIIDREAPQETIYSSMMPVHQPDQAPPISEELPPVEEASSLPDHWKKQPIPPKHLIAAGALILVCFIVFISFFSLFKSKSAEVTHKEPVSQIKEALAQFPAVQFSFNPGSGKLFLVGHVLTNVEYQEMRYRIDQIDFIRSTEDTVVIDEGVSKTMNEVIGNNADWKGVNIRAVGAGKFAAVGYVQTSGEAAQLSEYLTVNFPYLDRLSNQVVSIENLHTELQAMLMGKGFGAVAIQLNNGEVVLSGVYNNKMLSEYDELLKEMNAVPGVTGVKNFAIPTSPNAAAIDLSQQFQVTGSSMFDGRGYSVILNGKIYTLGDVVDGLNITAIEPNTILLEKDGVKYKIDYTR